MMYQQRSQKLERRLEHSGATEVQWLSTFCPPYNPLREGEVVLYDGVKINDKVESLARAVAAHSAGMETPPLFVGMAEGGLWLTEALLNSPLLRRTLPSFPELVLVDAKRYSGQSAGGGCTVIRPLFCSPEDLQSRIKDRALVIIDDMLDEGRSFADAREFLLDNGAAGCSCCVLLARHKLHNYEDLGEGMLGAPLVLDKDFPGASPWIFGCGPDWGRDEHGPEEKTLSRYRAELSGDGRSLKPVVAAFAESLMPK